MHMAEHEADVEAILAALEDKMALAGAGERDVIRAQLTTPGGRGQAQLAEIRKMAAGADSAEEAAALRRRILSLEATSEDDGDGQTPLPVFIEDARSKVAWDCETVLCLSRLAHIPGTKLTKLDQCSHIQQHVKSSSQAQGARCSAAREANPHR